MTDCGICRFLRRNGGADCDPDPEDFNKPCEAFEPIEKEED